MLNTDPSGQCIPFIETHCLPFWVGSGNYTGGQDFQNYSADVVKGLALPLALVADGVLGSHMSQSIIQNGGVGVYLGSAATSLLLLGAAGGTVAASAVRGALAGAWADYGAQVLGNLLAGTGWGQAVQCIDTGQLLNAGLLGGLAGLVTGPGAALVRALTFHGSPLSMVVLGAYWGALSSGVGLFAQSGVTPGKLLFEMAAGGVTGAAFSISALLVPEFVLAIAPSSSEVVVNIVAGTAAGFLSNTLSNLLHGETNPDRMIATNAVPALILGTIGGIISTAITKRIPKEVFKPVLIPGGARTVPISPRAIRDNMGESTSDIVTGFLSWLSQSFPGTLDPLPPAVWTRH